MDSPSGLRTRARAVPLAGFGVIAATAVYGLAAQRAGFDLGSGQPPLLYRWDWQATPLVVPAAGVLAGATVLAPRLRSTRLSPFVFSAAVLFLALAVRLALGAARGGVDGWWAVYEVPNAESQNEYLPVLPAFEFGTRFFLDTFAEIGTSLPVHSVGHPPGLLVALSALGIDSAPGMAALTIGAGVLSVPLVYLVGRRLLDESQARAATLLYAFAPSAVLHGVTSADALFATLALLAMVALVARRAVSRSAGPLALGVASFFSYANLAVGAVAAMVVLRRDGVRSTLLLCASCGAGLLALYGLLHLTTGFDPIGAVRSAEIVYREGVAAGRPYGFWVFGSPVAFLIAAGLPLAWLALRALAEREAVAAALFTVLAFSAVLGFTKAETERIYLFLVPLLCLAAATTLPRRHLPAVLGALALQAIATELFFETIW